jgi:nucleotide-binding universal stress UspA family protein
MFHNILAPTDGSPLSEKAVECATSLARALRAKVTYMVVLEPTAPDALFRGKPVSVAMVRRWEREVAELILVGAADKAKEAEVEFSTSLVEDDDPFSGIIRKSQELDCDLIVMASHGRRGVKAVLLGSVTSKVLAHSTIPVLVTRSRDGEA